MGTQVDENAELSPVAIDGQLDRTNPPVPARTEVEIDEAGAVTCYANFCRVTAHQKSLSLTSV